MSSSVYNDGKVLCEYPSACKHRLYDYAGPLLSHQTEYEAEWGFCHEERKRENGWYDNDFFPSKQPTKRYLHDRKLRTNEAGYTSTEEYNVNKRAKLTVTDVAESTTLPPVMAPWDPRDLRSTLDLPHLPTKLHQIALRGRITDLGLGASARRFDE